MDSVELTFLPLNQGDMGESVLRLQQSLKEQGFYTVQLDGVFGFRTEVAVRNFQKASQLAVTGIVDESTWLALMQGRMNLTH